MRRQPHCTDASLPQSRGPAHGERYIGAIGLPPDWHPSYVSGLNAPRRAEGGRTNGRPFSGIRLAVTRQP
jgi:hypothetical protein